MNNLTVSKQSTQTTTTKMKGSRKHNWLYVIIKTIFSAMAMIYVYFNYLKDTEPAFTRFMYIFLFSCISSVLISWFLRLILRYWEMELNFQARLTIIMQHFLYSLLISLGFITMIFEKYDFEIEDLSEIWTMLQDMIFWELVAILLFLKICVYLLCDWMADKAAFGG